MSKRCLLRTVGGWEARTFCSHMAMGEDDLFVLVYLGNNKEFE